MKIDKKLFDEIAKLATESPRLRMNYDLRNDGNEQSQRMQNVLLPGTFVQIHGHRGSTVVRQAHQPMIVVLRGKIRQNFYDEAGQLVESFDVSPCSEVMGFSVELGRWHNTECVESGTVILERKDGRLFES